MTSTSTSTTPATTTTTAITTIVATKALVRSIGELIGLQAKVTDKFASCAAMLRKDADESKIDRKVAGLMLANAFKGAYEQAAPKATNKLEGESDDAYVTRMLDKSAPDRSKMLTLAYPKTEDAAKELEAARTAGLGVNAQLEIARGNETVASIQAKRTEAASKGARPPGGATTSTSTSTTTTPAAQNAADTAKGLTPKERVLNQIAALWAYAKEAGITGDELGELFNEYAAERSAEASADK